MKLLCILLMVVFGVTTAKKKPISEYTDKDWDRVAREWERDEVEEDEAIMKEQYEKHSQGFKFDPNGKINPQDLLAQSKRGKPTMVFLTVREEICKSEKQLQKFTSKWVNMLLNGNVPVQNFPVASNRAIFMVQEGSLSYQIKDFLLKQPEIESVTIDQQIWKPGSTEPEYPGKEEYEKQQAREAIKKDDIKKKPKTKESKHEDKKFADIQDNVDKFFKEEAKIPVPVSESNEVEDSSKHKPSDNDIIDNRTEL